MTDSFVICLVKPAACAPLLFLFKSCLFHSPSPRPHALRSCARQPRGCYSNWLCPFVMLRATPQLYAHPRPCSGSAGLMGQPCWFSPGHNRTHIGVCSLDTNRRAVLARILLDGSATLDAARAAIGHGAAIRPADLRVPALVMLVLHPCQQAASHLPCTRPPDRLSPGHRSSSLSPLFYCSFCDRTQFFQASRTSFLLVHPRRTRRRPP